jgi:hypothetical protein
MRFALAALVLIASTTHADPRWSSTAKARCSYYNGRTDIIIDNEPCIERWGVINGDVTGVYVLRRGGTSITLTFIQKVSKDQWGNYVLRERPGVDRPAVRYEENRDEYHYATLDLRETLDVKY